MIDLIARLVSLLILVVGSLVLISLALGLIFWLCDRIFRRTGELRMVFDFVRWKHHKGIHPDLAEYQRRCAQAESEACRSGWRLDDLRETVQKVVSDLEVGNQLNPKHLCLLALKEGLEKSKPGEA